MPTLVEQVLEVEAALERASIPHAFGGALALAFHIAEPRGTRDIDVNVFVASSKASEVFAALPDGVSWTEDDLARVGDEGQVRLFWDDTPLDLFFSTHALHDLAWVHIERVPFAGSTIPILGVSELVVFKAFFDRTKDWADIEEITATGVHGLHEALGWLVDLLGSDDPRVGRLRARLHETPDAGDRRFDP